MLFKSQILTQASGSIGGTTFSHNRSGMYQRARSIPTNPQSANQVAVRMYLADAVTAWGQTLTQAERDAWTTYATNVPVVNKLGDTVFLTGQQMYIRSYVAGVQGGLSPATFSVAPTIFDTGDTGEITLASATAATPVATFAIAGSPAWAEDDDAYALIALGIPQNPTVNFYKSPFRFNVAVGGDSVTPLTALTATPTGDRVFAAGQRVFACVRILQSDGRLSNRNVFNVLAS